MLFSIHLFFFLSLNMVKAETEPWGLQRRHHQFPLRWIMELDDRLKPCVRLDPLSTEPSPQAAISTTIRPIIKLDGKMGDARLGKTERLKNKRDTSGNSFAKNCIIIKCIYIFQAWYGSCRQEQDLWDSFKLINFWHLISNSLCGSDLFIICQLHRLLIEITGMDFCCHKSAHKHVMCLWHDKVLKVQFMLKTNK